MNPEYKLDQLPLGNQVLVGRGKLTWMKSERISDRYGAIWLMGDNDSSFTTHKPEKQPLWFPPANQLGSLYARVIDARESTHIGDLFRGIEPKTPKTGDIFLLGTGTASVEPIRNTNTFLITPTEPRDSDWLNPLALYNCHESIVELIWIPIL